MIEGIKELMSSPEVREDKKARELFELIKLILENYNTTYVMKDRSSIKL